MRTCRGSSIVMWAVMFGLVFASLTLYRIHLKRAVQNKMYQTVDYLMWTYQTKDVNGAVTGIVREEPVDYEGNTNVGGKSVTAQHSEVTRSEKKDRPVESSVNSTQSEHSTHTSVAEGSDAILQLFNMNNAIETK